MWKWWCRDLKPGQLEHQDEHLPWPDKSPDLNIIKRQFGKKSEKQIPFFNLSETIGW